MNNKVDILNYLEDLKKENKEKWEDTSVTNTKRINKDNIYKMTPHWLQIDDGVVAVYADMINSTSVNISKYRHTKTRGQIFEIFTGALAKIFHDFDVVHIDIEGDGALGVWNGGDDRLKALCAAITFRTYVGDWLSDFVSKVVSDVDKIGVRIGIDEEVAAVKFVGVRGEDQNLVWAGEPIPSASKLCKLHNFYDENGGEIDQISHISVSDRFYNHIKSIDEIRLSCGCSGDGLVRDKTPIWKEIEIPDNEKENFGFEKYDLLITRWCPIHGNEYCRAILSHIND